MTRYDNQFGVDLDAEWALAQVERTRRENAQKAAETPAAVSAPDSASPPREAGSGDVGRQERPAERLRSAAALVERRALETPLEPWAKPFVRDTLVPWVALMSPDLAAPLAAWLRGQANAAEMYARGTVATGGLASSRTQQALAVADALLGEEAGR